jgi:argininosuccinate lyase
VQQYVPGEEFSVEIFSVHGRDHVLGCTKKHLGRAPFFVETGHDFPARLSPSIEQEIRSEALRALSAVGYRLGPSHVECRLASDGRACIIEVNPRLAGGMIPRAIEMATGVDLLGALVDFFAGRSVDLAPVRDRCAAIRFFVAERPGTVEALHSSVGTLSADGVDAIFVPIKSVGTRVEPQGDFRDRLACIVAASDRETQLNHALDFMLEQATVKIHEARQSPLAADAGNDRKILRAEALDIVCKPPSRGERIAHFDRLAAIDEAHLIMLVKANIFGAAEVAPILVEIETLRADRYSEIAAQQAPHGVYALYEQLLITRLGERVGGIVHTARSRNDINACLFKLEVRDWLTTTFRSLWRLRAALLAKAADTVAVILPVYSQFQPGQPGTLAYYLWSLDTALRRDQQAFLNLIDDLQVCPMGAGAGAGTDFPIQPEITATLLGFSTSHQSALDAIASRDLALRLLSAWAVCSTVLSRLAHDLQIWTMRDVGFFDLPDDLAGGSSMMPQKKNPYLLEIVKGKLVSLPGALGFALHAMQKTPFSNSIEVGTEGVSACAGAAITFSESCDLLRLMVDALVPQTVRAEDAARKGTVIATQVANVLVRERKISFHEAHRMTRAHIIDALETGREPLQSLRELTEHALDDLGGAVQSLTYGGGPGVVAGQLSASQAELRRNADDFCRRTYCWIEAERRRRSIVRALIAKASAGAV